MEAERPGQASAFQAGLSHHNGHVETYDGTYEGRLTETIVAIQASPPQDLIIIDNNYLDRVTERRRILKENTSRVAGAVPEGIPALHETWTYLLSEYLPRRYPTMFTLSEDRSSFRNLVTGVSLPLTPPEDPVDALHALGETVEDDMFLLVETAKGHRAVAFVCCHPGGFDPSDKLGKLMKDIHTPVPSYEKIGASMERFFSRLQVGKSVKRMNVSSTVFSFLISEKILMNDAVVCVNPRQTLQPWRLAHL